MGEDIVPEGGKAPVSQETPTPKFTEPSVSATGAKSTTSVPDPDAIAAKVLEQLRPEIDKQLQSVKDKRIARIEGQLASLGQLAELEEMGAEIPEKVKLEYRLRQLEGRSAPTPEDKGMSQDEAVARAKNILSKAGVDMNDPDLTALWQKAYSGNTQGYLQMLEDVTEMAVKKSKQPSPTSAQSPAPGGESPSPIDADALLADIQEAQRTGDLKKMAELEKKAKEVGLYK